MPYKNKQPCIYPMCNQLVMQGRYCNLHKIDTSQHRSNTAWYRLSKQVLEEEPICRLCKQAYSTDTDHIIPLPTGSSERSNLQGLCHRCHSIKTRRETSR